jgi:hypothetical protein
VGLGSRGRFGVVVLFSTGGRGGSVTAFPARFATGQAVETNAAGVGDDHVANVPPYLFSGDLLPVRTILSESILCAGRRAGP